MEGGEQTYNPGRFSRSTAVEKLKYFHNKAQSGMKAMGLETGSKIRFRGDALEISLDRSELTNEQNRNASDSGIYIKTGLLISLISKAIQKAGFRPVVRTFPRFDEPDLVGFVYLGDDMVTRNKRSAKTSSQIVNEKEGYDLTLANNLAAKRSLELHHITKNDELKTIQRCLSEGLEGCKISVLNSNLKEKLEKLQTAAIDKDRKVLIVRSRQNTPIAWIEAGFFLGEAVTEFKKHGVVLSHLSLDSCPSFFQERLRNIPGGSIYRYPQLVCLVERPDS